MMGRKAISKDMKAEIIRLHGNACLNCGSTEDIELHHVVGLELGGNHVASNIVPLCHTCHKAVTFQQLLLQTSCRESCKCGGRPRKKWVDNAEDIFDDFLHCRISKIEAKERLNVNYNFCDRPEYKEWLVKQKVKTSRNGIDHIMCSHNCIFIGQDVGFIEYDDGTRIVIPWSIDQEPKSGESIVPTGKWSKRVKKRAISLDLYKNTVINDSEEPPTFKNLSDNEK